ncbi:MAG TPA: hypothetical protein VKE98_15770, partial [Gemmataceae bacterium]|nr:hypothetical protein [Gemmataceae bacterium]
SADGRRTKSNCTEGGPESNPSPTPRQCPESRPHARPPYFFLDRFHLGGDFLVGCTGGYPNELVFLEIAQLAFLAVQSDYLCVEPQTWSSVARISKSISGRRKIALSGGNPRLAKIRMFGA